MNDGEKSRGGVDGNAMHLRELLRQCLNGQTASGASSELKNVLKEPESVSLLGFLLEQERDPDVRQLAAILMRRRIIKVWNNLRPDVQMYLKQCLTNRVLHDHDRKVRLAVCHCLATVGKICWDSWNLELCSFLYDCSTSHSQYHREVAMTVFASLIESVGTPIKEKFDDLVIVFDKGLKDPECEAVRASSLRGVQTLSLLCETKRDFELIKPLVTSIFQYVQASVPNNEDIVQLGMEILNDMIECMDIFKFEDAPFMVRFGLKIASAEMACGIRNQALHFIHLIGKMKPRFLYGNGLVDEILDVIIDLASEDEAEDIDEDELSGHRIAAQCMDSLALNLPNKHIYSPTIAKLGPLFQSNEPLKRKAAFVLLGIMSEGCEQEMRLRLHEILPLVFRGFEDSSVVTQVAATICFSQLADYLQPEILRCHQEAMKHLMHLLNSANEKILQKVCFALEIFCEQLPSHEVKIYLPNVMPKLVDTLTKACRPVVQENCLAAIGALASSAEQEFFPYAETSLLLLKNILSLDQGTPQILVVKGKATEVVGFIAKAIGPAQFSSCREGFLQLIFKNVETYDNHAVRRSTFNFLSMLVDSMKDGFHLYIERTMVLIFASLFSNDGLMSPTQTKEIADSIDSDDEEDEDIDVRTGYIEEMECALSCLQTTWEECGLHCMKYIKSTTEVVDLTHQHFSGEIREMIAGLMSAVITSVHKLFPTEISEYVPGLPVSKTNVHENTLKLWQEKFWPVFKEMLNDDDKEVVTEVTINLGDLFDALGPQLLENNLDEIVNVILVLLDNKHNCQKFTEIDQDEESRLEEEQMFNALSGLISGLSRALGGQFLSIYSNMHPKVVALATHRESTCYRAIGIGCAAAVFESMGELAAPYVSTLLHPVFNALKQKKNAILRRNAAFASGVFIQVNPAVGNENIMEFLRLLHPILCESRDDLSENENLVLDNAIAALARIIVTVPAQSIPLAELVPLWLKNLPIIEDLNEVEAVMQALLHMFNRRDMQSFVERHLTQFIAVSIETAISEKSILKDATKQMADEMNCSILRRLGSSNEVVRELLNVFEGKPACIEFVRRSLQEEF